MKRQILYIGGLPESGKTELAIEMGKRLGVPIISTDKIFNKEIFPKLKNNNKFICYSSPSNAQIGKHFSISKLVNSKEFASSYFFEFVLKKTLHLFDSYLTGLIIVEGFIGDYIKEFSEFFGTKGFEVEKVLFISKLNLSFEERKFNISSFNYDILINHIQNFYSSKIERNLINGTIYQKFDVSGVSDSEQKLNCSSLLNIVKSNDRVLDIGCNSGYFCFKISDKTSGDVIGIDFNPDFISQAEMFNRLVYKSLNCKFYCLDILENQQLKHLSNGVIMKDFNLIICFSTFHYFGDLQIRFLKHVRDLLVKKGLFLLEVELSPTSSNSIEKIKRKMDENPCYFPSLTKFFEMVSDLFVVLRIQNAPFQNGSCYDRKIFLLEPK